MSDFEDRLRALLQDRAERYKDGGAIPPTLIRRARRAMVATAVAACLAASGLAAGGYFAVAALRPEAEGRQLVSPAPPAPPEPPAPAHRGSERTPTPPAPEPTLPPAPRHSTVGGWTFDLASSLPDAIGALIAGPDALYSAYVEDLASDRGRVARVDVATGSITRSRPFTGAIDMALRGGWLWITSESSGGAEHRSVYRLDPQTLAVRGEISLDGPTAAGFPGVILSAPSGLWVSVGSELVLLDPSTGATLRRVSVPSVAAPLAIEPSGRLLYVATRSPGDTSVSELTERDAATGAVVLRVPTRGFDLGVTSGAATALGLWISVPTGNLGGTLFVRRSDLGVSLGVSVGPGNYSNGIHVSVAAGRLWLEDEGSPTIGCADPATGELFAQVRLPGTLTRGVRLTDVAMFGSDLYVGTGAGIVRITPNARCGL